MSGHLAGAGGKMRRPIVFGAVAAGALACMMASVAVAAPTGGYAVFAQCPTHAAEVNACIYAQIEGGHMTIGKTIVPVTRTQALQGGMLRPGEPGVKRFAGALDGETLTSVGQPVPGDLFGATLTAVTELAAPASSIVLNRAAEESGIGTALTLPTKVKLDNPFLGVECEIGSDADPIVLNLTTGATSGGPKGNPGGSSVAEGGGIVVQSGVSLVSNTFMAPPARGCGSGFVDGLLDAKLGLPSNRNAIVLNARIEIANSELVEEAEG